MSDKNMHINNDISAYRVLLIDENGNKLGEFLKKDAISMAEERNLDLVQVSEARVPTCKFMDYKKYIYEQKKKMKASKSAKSKQKEIRLSPSIARADLDVRIAKIRELLAKGSQVKVSVTFKGAELRHLGIGREKCQEIISAVEDVALLEDSIQTNGKVISFLLSPK